MEGAFIDLPALGGCVRAHPPQERQVNKGTLPEISPDIL